MGKEFAPFFLAQKGVSEAGRFGGGIGLFPLDFLMSFVKIANVSLH
jgi:hypothetical protein